MPTVSPDDLLLLRAIADWKILAVEVADSGPLDGQDALRFWSLASLIVDHITVRHPHLDPTPIIELAMLDPDRPALQSSRWALADRAVMVADVVEGVILDGVERP